MSSNAQIKANQANAQFSTGLISDTGDGKSCLNVRVDEAADLSVPKIQAVTGLTGRTVLLPAEDAAAYTQLVESFVKYWSPADDAERNLVQSLADTEWRLQRIPSLESGIYALGRLEFANLFPNEGEATRAHLIEAKIYMAYERQLKNLSIQEGRLRRQREKDTAALRERQENRKREEQKRLAVAARAYIAAVQENRKKTFDLGQFGFEFSLVQIEAHALELDPGLAGSDNLLPSAVCRRAA